MSSTGPTNRNYERRLARQRQLELMEAAASGMEIDMMELDLSERSGMEASSVASTATPGSSHPLVAMSPIGRGGSIRSSAIFERGDVYSSRPNVNLMDHTTGIYEAEEVGKKESSFFGGLFKTRGAASGDASANYPYDANVEDLDELSTLKQRRRSRLTPVAAACQRCWRSRFCLVLMVLVCIGIIAWVSVLIAQTRATVNTVDKVYVVSQKARYSTILQSLVDSGVLEGGGGGLASAGGNTTAPGMGFGQVSHVYNDTKSPQYHALRWIAYSDPARVDPSDPMILQRYALATFFFGSYLKYSQANGVQQLEEGEVLEAVPNPGWIQRDLWLSEKSHCLWFGVDCAAENQANNHFQPTSKYDILGDVVGIVLPDNFIVGTIPSEFGLLSKLEVLDLSTNKVSGSLPPQIGTLYTLQQLALDDNKMTGTIPSDIGKLESIKYMRLGKNQFKGRLPTELGRLAGLRHLSVNFNKLSGPLPLLDSLTSLTQLWLDNNDINGAIPFRWGLLRSLQELILSQNQLTGSFPSEVASCKNLKTIKVDYNQLSGQLVDHMFIPLENSLELFDIQHNAFTGEVPESLGNMKRLTTLLINNNKFSGPLPDAWVSLPSLQVWHMQANDIEGYLPDFSVTPVLEEFWAYNNALQGSIPTNLGTATHLETLYLEHNDLTGTIPNELETLTNLQELRIFDNEITGSMPSHVCKLKKNNLADIQIDCQEIDCEQGCCHCKDGV